MKIMRKETFFEFAKQLFAIDSPTGYTHHAMDFLKTEAEKLGYKAWLNAKGNLLIEVDGEFEGITVKGYVGRPDNVRPNRNYQNFFINSRYIKSKTASAALDMMEIDELGLDNTDRRMLEAIISFYNGGPVGLETISALIGEESVTIEDVYEPYLLQLGFIARTPRGRVVLPNAYKHLGKKLSKKNQEFLNLFVESDVEDE